jgi:PAS domain S-box-containing protein
MVTGGRTVSDDSTADRPAATYGAVFDHMLEGCQIISRDYRYLYVNAVVADQGRRKPEDLLGKTMSECYPGIELTEMFDHLRQCITYAKPHTMENEFHFPGGTVGWFELRMEPLPEGAIILSIDITSRKEAENRQREIDELRTVFMQIISRQMVTPLTDVRKEMELIKRAPNQLADSAQRGQLDAAYTAILEITECADDMVAALGIDTGSIDKQDEVVLFDDIWKPLYSQLKRDCALKQITLTYKDPFMPLPRMRCNVNQIRLVLSRLIDNALTYTPPNGRIAIQATRQADGIIRFEISDSGIGIPDPEQARIFSRFCRGSNATAANPDGMGVSLAVARHYVEQHGGRIGFTSKKDKGSTFWVELPTKV